MCSEGRAVIAIGECNSQGKRDDFPARAVRGVLMAPGPFERLLCSKSLSSFLLTLASIIALLIVGPFDQAVAQSAGPLKAYRGFFDELPKHLSPGLELEVSHTEGTDLYGISTPWSITGITLVVPGGRSSKATAKRRTTPNGKQLKFFAWSAFASSPTSFKELHILSFDGLGAGENVIELNVGNSEQAKTYQVSVKRAETVGSDSALTSLELTESGLSPSFSGDTRSYALEVPYRVADLRVKAQSKELGTSIQLRGTTAAGTQLKVSGMTVSGLAVGRNVIEVLTTAEDASTTDNYTVAVERQAPSKETELGDLSLAQGAGGVLGLQIPSGGGILQPAFAPETTSYDASVPAEVTAVKMAIRFPTTAALRLSGTAAYSTPLKARSSEFSIGSIQINDTVVNPLRRRVATFSGLQSGRNTIEIEVTAEDGVTKKTYGVAVTRGLE